MKRDVWHSDTHVRNAFWEKWESSYLKEKCKIRGVQGKFCCENNHERCFTTEEKVQPKKKSYEWSIPIIMLLMFFLWPALPNFGVACKLLYQLGEVACDSSNLLAMYGQNSFGGVRDALTFDVAIGWFPLGKNQLFKVTSRPNMVCGFGGRSFPPKGDIHSFKNKKFKFGACTYWNPWDCCYFYAHHSLCSPQSNHFHIYHTSGSFLHTTC